MKEVTADELLHDVVMYKEPVRLSFRSNAYYHGCAVHLEKNKKDIFILCKILMNSYQVIFGRNAEQVKAGVVVINEERFILSDTVISILLGVFRARYHQGEVLFDSCKMLDRHAPAELEVITKVYNYPEKDGYLVRKKEKK